MKQKIRAAICFSTDPAIDQNGFQVACRSEFQIPNVDAQSCPNAGANWDDIVFLVQAEDCDTKASDQIGGAIDADPAAIEIINAWQIIDEHHGSVAIAAKVPANGWALPECLMRSHILGEKVAFAITGAGNKSAAAFLAQNISIGQAVF